MSGVVMLPSGTRVWALTSDTGNRRNFQLYQLSDQEWAVEAERHADFRRWVGTHTDMNGTHEIHPQSEHCKFYDKWPWDKADARLDGAVPIGWFSE